MDYIIYIYIYIYIYYIYIYIYIYIYVVRFTYFSVKKGGGAANLVFRSLFSFIMAFFFCVFSDE